MISKINIIRILSYTFYYFFSFVLLWLLFVFIADVGAHSFNILSFIKLLLMMGVTFTIGIVLNNIIKNKKTNSRILSVAIILGLGLNINIFLNMLTTDVDQKYVGTHNGSWEGSLLNQYNQGSARFTVEESGYAELVLSGEFSAIHKGQIEDDKFITDKNQSCSIVDQGSGFKIVLIWTGVNVDVMLKFD